MTRSFAFRLVLTLAMFGAGACGGKTQGQPDSGSSSSSDGGSGSCTDACHPEAVKCSGSQVQQCEKQSDGCYDWSAPADCPTNQTCVGHQCVLACSDQCINGHTQCNNGEVQTCTKQSNGCTAWSAPMACANGGTCSGGECASSCTDQCVAGATQCSGPEVQTCAMQANGCTDWNPAQACPANEGCSGGQCMSTCTDACTQGDTQCSGSEVQTCEVQANGCTGWSAPASCPSNQACSGGQCTTTCSNHCTLGATQCSGAQIQTCQTQASGCTDWSPAQACPAGNSCSGDQCAPTSCTPGTLQCSGTVLQVCNANHAWQTQQVCAQSCDPLMTACTEQTTCTSGARRCSGNEAEVCNSNGTAWLGAETCAVGCSSGLCTGACNPGDTRCNGNTPETCNSTGNAWTQGTACTTFCAANGTCADGALTIDANANATLDGEHWIDGDVVIKNSSVLTVPSGKLIIHANNVTLDVSSQIVVAPTGSDPRGTGGNGASSCSAGPYCTASGAGGGAGGSYGTAGASPSNSTVSCYDSYWEEWRSCTVGGSAPAAYAIADDEAAAGAQGGTGACSSGGTPGLGGGLLVIYASSIQMQGTVTANGQAGSGCAGGGSGGGVVLRADGNLSFTGSISVAPGNGGSSGGGAGGNGVVKLLYGNTKTLTGSVVGVTFSSFMPPYDVSSTSHPDPTHWYNDGFTDFELAWSKPFSNSAGYYYNLNTTYGYTPAPSNSMYLATEAQLYSPSALTTGTNDFHITTVGPFANLGTMEHRFVVNINSTPPAIASSSHPDSSTWYNNTSPYFTWTLPHADSDVVNFYWVFDSFASTIPSKTSNVIPMDLSNPQNSKQLLLPNQQPGIHYLHVIAEDTAGYLTQAAGHFRVQIGSQPGQGSVSGSVTDASTGAFLSGATVTLNRGIQTTTTDGNGGYAFPNTVFAQQYEIRASMSGYQDAVKTVTVVAGQTATVNLALSK